MIRHTVTCLLVLLISAPIASAQTLASDENRRTALGHYRSGQELLSAEQFEGALREFDAAIALDPLFTDAHYGRGQSFMALQRYASAVQAFDRCIEAARDLHGLREKDRVTADRQLDDTLRELRETLRRMRGQAGRGLRAMQLEQRIQDLDKSRTSLGDAFQPPAGVLLALGSAHFRSGNRAQAERFWTDAVTVNSTLGEGWNNLAVVYMGSGRKKEAEDAVKNAERAGFRVNPRLEDDIKRMPPQAS